MLHDNLADMRQVLNRLVYEKGGWMLHMLRGRLGTETFWAGIRDYYRRHRDGNVSTDDFRRVMEEVSGQNLAGFFRQWLKRPGSPEVKGTWRYRPEDHRIDIELDQVQPGDPFRLPIEIGIIAEGSRAPDREDRADRAAASIRTQGRQGTHLGRPRPELLGPDEVERDATSDRPLNSPPRDHVREGVVGTGTRSSG